MAETAAVPQTPIQSARPQAANSIIVRMATRFGIDPAKMLGTLKATAFRQRQGEPEVTNEQMMALLVVCEEYRLNPWIRGEIFAFPDKNQGIVPVVGVDGWSRLINTHDAFDGVEFVDGPPDKEGRLEWVECVLHRKDRSHPTKIREYMRECRRATPPWGSHPNRMLRHKALIQCARVAFGFAGIYDQDEAERIVEGETVRVENAAIAALNEESPAEAKPEAVGQAPTADSATPPPSGSSLTYAQLADDILKCESSAQLDKLIPEVGSFPEDQQAELRDLLRSKAAELISTAKKK